MSALHSSEYLIRAQQEENRKAQQQYEASRLSNLTLRRAIQDMGASVKGVFEDLFQNTPPRPLPETFTADGRLQGIGFLLIALSLAMLLVDAVAVR